ncbi:nSTAND1 domain-containing NTPase [Streptomyces tubercidicus]
MMLDMAALRGESALESGLVRIRDGDAVVGAGFLVTPEVICTCAHVVADALGLPRDTDTAPSAAVPVEFPLLRDADQDVPTVRARVVSWKPLQRDDSGDVALLRLDRRVPNAHPVALVDGASVWGHSFRAYGFPDGGDHGVWATGTLRSVQGTGWVQMDAAPGSRPITNGYSGAAVWDDEQGGVVGLTVAAGHGALAGTAFLVPSASLVDEEVLPPTCPFRGLEVFEEEDSEFFHGRENDAGRLAESIAQRPLTVVVGPSGCGKSSLIRSGLLPLLRADGMGVSVLRPVPGDRPETVLAHVLVPALEPGAGEIDRLSKAETLARLLRDGSGGEPSGEEPGDEDPLGEAEPVDAARTYTRPPPSRVPQAVAGLRDSLQKRAGAGGHLLVVDQLEEYAGAEPTAARTLLGLLAELAGSPRSAGGRGLRVVATAREESLGDLVTSRTSGALSDAVFLLAPLDADDLHRAITGPVAAVPGLWLEPGLATRIVEDAADQPGRMPLVEFTLTRLWERRERSMLTHTAYDELGGVAGTLAGYADHTYRTHVPESEETVARRLFLQLARPDDRGGYTRRATPLTQLDPAAVALARRLARGKLVVIDHTTTGAEIAELTHEALTRLWPRLRRWLDDSRKFRVWQEQLRTDMARWEGKDKEPEALQRGKTLAEGAEWLQLRPEDMTADERAYIEAGRRYEQRTVRRLRAVGAVLMALLLAAGTLGTIAFNTSQDLKAQLRTLASRALAKESGSRQAEEPGTALQFALAAWHTDRTPQAREELLNQYVRAQYLRGAHSGLWRGRVQELAATPDGRTLVVRSKPAGNDPHQVSVVTGVLEGKPRHYTLPGVPESEQTGEISPDGRHYAVATPDGTVRLWRLDGKGSEPTRLGRELTDRRDKVKGDLEFSADGSRLMRTLNTHAPDVELTKPRTFVDVWHLGDLKPLPVAATVVSAARGQEVAFGKDPDTVVVTTSPSHDPKTPSKAALLDLRTGHTLRKLRAKGDDWTSTDATAEYGYETKNSDDDRYVDVALGRWGTDDTYVTRLPVDDEPGYSDPMLAVARRDKGGPMVLSPVGNALVVAYARPAPRPAKVPGLINEYAWAKDGRLVAWMTNHKVQVVDLLHGGSTTVEPPHQVTFDRHWSLAWTAGGKQLLLWQEGGSHLYVYDPDTLSDPVDVPLDAGPKTPQEPGLISAVAPLPDGDVTVLTNGANLLQVDPERGVQTGEPLPVDRSPVLDSSPLGQLRGRPGHPHQVAVVTSNDEDKGRIQIWDVRTRKRTEALEGDKISPRIDHSDASNLAFSPSGRYLVVEHADGKLHRWDVAKGTTVGTPITTEITENVNAVTDSGTVITQKGSEGVYELWDANDGTRIGTIPGGSSPTSALRGTELTVENRGWLTAYDLRPDSWFTHLCKNAGRDFTEEEREHLPPGTPPEAPCAP